MYPDDNSVAACPVLKASMPSKHAFLSVVSGATYIDQQAFASHSEPGGESRTAAIFYISSITFEHCANYEEKGPGV